MKTVKLNFGGNVEISNGFDLVTTGLTQKGDEVVPNDFNFKLKNRVYVGGVPVAHYAAVFRPKTGKRLNWGKTRKFSTPKRKKTNARGKTKTLSTKRIKSRSSRKRR